MEPRLTGKVVLVTGSAAGIGRGIAEVFAEEGASLAINSRTTVEEGQAFARSLPDAMYHRADVSTDGEARRLVQDVIDHFGRLDVLVNNVGGSLPIAQADFDGLTDEAWRTILDGNLMSAWYPTRAAVPHLKATGEGAVINISSIASVRSINWGKSALGYGVAKAALNHMTALLAARLGPEIRVNAVLPGVTFSRSSTGALYPMVEQNAPLGRIGQPRDVGEACLLMACARYVTGQTLLVDGGLLLGR